jgi:membrane protease YdiL (CAAX protease family)
VYDSSPELPLVAPVRPVLPIERLGAILEIIICSGFPSQILLILVLRGFGMSPRLADGSLSPPFIFTLSLVDAVLVIGLVLFLLKAHHESPRDVLIGRRPILREALLGIVLLPAIFIAVLVLLAIILTLAPWLHNVPRNPLEDMLRSRGDALIFAAVVMISGGVREEVQRGFILHRFDQYLGGAAVGVVVYSVAFGLGHADQGYDAMLITGTLGALWGLTYLARRSIIAPMVSHAGFNVLQLAKFLALR